MYRLHIMGSIRDQDIACSAQDHKGSNFDSRVWRAVLSDSSYQEVCSFVLSFVWLKPYILIPIVPTSMRNDDTPTTCNILLYQAGSSLVTTHISMISYM